jgi:hypothetical protein
MQQKLFTCILLLFFGGSLPAQVSNAELLEEIKSLRNQLSNMRHQFDRMDTNFAREVRLKVYRFLGKELNPPRPFSNVQELKKAGYGY